jgi:hypothetical protein
MTVGQAADFLVADVILVDILHQLAG